MAGLAVVLVSILAFLYARSKAYDPAVYFQNVTLLRQLKQLDARWELDVLKSRLGLETSYSSLIDPMAGFEPSWDRLQTIATGQREPAHHALLRVIDDYHREIQDKVRLIQQFKAPNTLLRAALASLPLAADNWRKLAAERNDQDISKALLDSLVYSQAPSDEKAADIESELAHLTSAPGSTTAGAAEARGIFVAHVRTVLREQPEVNSLLASIATVPTAASLDDLENILSSAKRKAEQQAERDRRNLLIFSAALAALLLYAAVSLIRSHGVIKRVNRDLKAANETLEQRVEERTRELRAAQNELVSAARQSGMAEIATNVLHNVGNALNSVVVSAGLIGTKLRESKIKGLADAVQLMNQHATDLGHFMTRDERGKRLPGYLTKLAEVLSAEKGANLEELESLTKGIDHIRDIVSTQQSYAGAMSLIEPVQVSELIEDALRMNAGSLSRRKVLVIKRWPDVPEVSLDKHLMLQILINLIANALQAMDTVTDRPHRLSLKAETRDGPDGRRLVIHVEDNGEGIMKENRPRLFSHGFTTRKGGHGFGLHSCALAAQAMEGQLSAHSDGAGQGAIFTLDLPLKEPSRKVVANL
jgi:two-component system, NtrC family, sensor kinase